MEIIVFRVVIYLYGDFFENRDFILFFVDLGVLYKIYVE